MTSLRLTCLIAGVALAASLTACADMTPRENSTAVGAGIGGVAGAVLGGTEGAAVGAVAGGVIGNQVKR